MWLASCMTNVFVLLPFFSAHPKPSLPSKTSKKICMLRETSTDIEMPIMISEVMNKFLPKLAASIPVFRNSKFHLYFILL